MLCKPYFVGGAPPKVEQSTLFVSEGEHVKFWKQKLLSPSLLVSPDYLSP